MTRVDGTLARTLDLEGDALAATAGVSSRRRLRLAPSMRLTGPGKYKVLEARRRHAQIQARRQLDLLDARENDR
jgi:hypothetical protein